MTDAQLSALLEELLAVGHEIECVEFKRDNTNPQEIGEYISALSNAASLSGRETAFMVWGVQDDTLDTGSP